jgi:hypothetical protein
MCIYIYILVFFLLVDFTMIKLKSSRTPYQVNDMVPQIRDVVASPPRELVLGCIPVGSPALRRHWLLAQCHVMVVPLNNYPLQVNSLRKHHRSYSSCPKQPHEHVSLTWPCISQIR